MTNALSVGRGPLTVACLPEKESDRANGMDGLVLPGDAQFVRLHSRGKRSDRCRVRVLGSESDHVLMISEFDRKHASRVSRPVDLHEIPNDPGSRRGSPVSAILFEFDDGGRAAAGRSGMTGDCAARAIAIACQLPYDAAYGLVADANAESGYRGGERSARNGCPTKVMRVIMKGLGWEWVPTMGIGTGCRVHLRGDELPEGRIIARVSGHYAAVVDGVVRDNHDSTRGGTRCVYGYWWMPSPV